MQFINPDPEYNLGPGGYVKVVVPGARKLRPSRLMRKAARFGVYPIYIRRFSVQQVSPTELIRFAQTRKRITSA
jgi:hypothetical protein